MDFINNILQNTIDILPTTNLQAINTLQSQVIYLVDVPQILVRNYAFYSKHAQVSYKQLAVGHACFGHIGCGHVDCCCHILLLSSKDVARFVVVACTGGRTEE